MQDTRHHMCFDFFFEQSFYSSQRIELVQEVKTTNVCHLGTISYFLNNAVARVAHILALDGDDGTMFVVLYFPELCDYKAIPHSDPKSK